MVSQKNQTEPSEKELRADALARYRRAVEAFNQLSDYRRNDYLVLEMAAAQKVFCHICSIHKVV